MNSTSEKLLEAMSTLAQSRIEKLKYDTTVKAYIYELGNLDIGQYKVKYNDNIFYAFSNDLTKTYVVGDNVYIKVPEGDFSNRKIIEGRCDEDTSARVLNTALVQSSISAISPTWDKFYNYDAAKSYGVVAGPRNTNEIFNFASGSHERFIQYAKNYDTIEIKADFETQFHSIPEGDNYGNYGLEITFFTRSTDENGQPILVTYRLDKTNFNGNPYRFSHAAEQSVVIQTQTNYLTGLHSIKLFAEFDNYDVLKTREETIEIHEPNIFVKNISLRYVQHEELQDDLYYLRIAALSGSLFTDAEQELKFQGDLIHNQQSILTRSSCKCYWFERDLTITIESKEYNENAGVGWRLIDNTRYVDFNVLTVLREETLYEREFKLVVVYSDSVVIEKTVTVTNSDFGFSIITYKSEADGPDAANTFTIKASSVDYDLQSKELVINSAETSVADKVLKYGTPISFILVDYNILQNNVGSTVTLTLDTNYYYTPDQEIQKPMAFWYAAYPDGSYKALQNGHLSTSIDLTEGDLNSLIYQKVTFYAAAVNPNYITQKNQNTLVAEDIPLNQIAAVRKITIRNGESIADLSIRYISADKYNYDINGDIDITMAETPKEISFVAEWETGKASPYTIAWFDKDGKIITETNYNVKQQPENSMIQEYWVDSNGKLWYTISKKYKVDCINNTLKYVVVTSNGQEYYFEKEIVFTKDGEKELSGKTYKVVIAPCVSATDTTKKTGYFALTLNADDYGYLKAYVYEDGELITDESDLKFEWEVFENTSILDNYGSVVKVQAGIKHDAPHYIKVKVILSNGIVAYNFYSIDTIKLSEYSGVKTLEEILSSITLNAPSTIEYNSSGLIPTYYSDNLSFTVDGKSGSIVGEKNIRVNGKKLSPNGSLPTDSSVNSNTAGIIKGSYTITDVVNDQLKTYTIDVYHTIVFLFSTAGNEAIDGWDGTRLTVDQNKGQYLYAPRLGAGKVDIDEETGNKLFTGVVMGDYAGKEKNIGMGLFGFNKGAEAFGLRTDGTAYIGNPISGQIAFDGNSTKINGFATIGEGTAAEKYYMELDLSASTSSDFAIQVGGYDEFDVRQPKFTVNYRGECVATDIKINGSSLSGGTIQNTAIGGGSSIGKLQLDTEGALVSEKGEVVFDSTGMFTKSVRFGNSIYHSSGQEQVGVGGYYTKVVCGGVGILEDNETKEEKYIGIQTIYTEQEEETNPDDYWNNEIIKKDITKSILLDSARDVLIFAKSGSIDKETGEIIEVGGTIQIGDGTNSLIINVPAELQQGIYARFA